MQRIDPKYTPEQQAAEAAAAAQVRANLKQQAEGPLNIPRFAFHSVSAALMIGSYMGLKVWMSNFPPLEDNFGGDFQYLTILSMIVTVITMALSALNDLSPGDAVFISLKRLFAMIALPVEILVSSVYWPLVLFAPKLMLPPKDNSDPASALMYIPLWIDLGLHLVPALAIVIDFFVFEERYRPPVSTRLAASLSVGVAAAYGFWIEYCAHWNNDRFPYPFLTMMEVENRIYIYLGAALFAFLTFQTLNALHK